MKNKIHHAISAILKKSVFFTILFLVTAYLSGIQPVKTDAASNSQIKLNSCYSNDTNKISIKAYIHGPLYDRVEIYRADKNPAQGGTFRFLDRIQFSDQVWYSGSNANNWYTTGPNNKIICYSHDSELEGNVIFADTSAKVGYRYYYRLVMKSEWEEDWPTLTSNTVSAVTRLYAPSFTRIHSLDGKSAILRWTRTAQTKGYQIYRYNGKKWSYLRTITKSSTLAYKDTKVAAGKTYKYKIRAYNIVAGKKIYSNFSSAGTVSLKQPTVPGDYKANSIYGPSLNTRQLTQVRRVVQSFKTNYIRKGMSDYDKALAAFLYLRSNCRYARKGWQYNNANTAWGALVYNEAQCSGFARAMKALCDGIGIKCYYVHADQNAYNPSHQWNELRVGGKWYIVDAQSGFFLAGSRTWRNSMGMSWNTKGLPKCNVSDHKKSGFYGSII